MNAGGNNPGKDRQSRRGRKGREATQEPPKQRDNRHPRRDWQSHLRGRSSGSVKTSLRRDGEGGRRQGNIQKGRIGTVLNCTFFHCLTSGCNQL